MALWDGNSTGIANALQGVNTLSYGWIFSLIVVAVWLVIVYRNQNSPIRDRIATGSFAAFITALTFRYLGLVTDSFFGFIIAIMILSLIPLLHRND